MEKKYHEAITKLSEAWEILYDIVEKDPTAFQKETKLKDFEMGVLRVMIEEVFQIESRLRMLSGEEWKKEGWKSLEQYRKAITSLTFD
jgi:hypothetical protein